MTRSFVRNIRDGSIILAVFASIWAAIFYAANQETYAWLASRPNAPSLSIKGASPSWESSTVPSLTPTGVMLATIIHNERANIREWVEFNMMSGVFKQVIYDYQSTDDVRDVLQPYIVSGNVTLVDWPPTEADRDAGDRSVEHGLQEAYAMGAERCVVGMETAAATRRECERWAAVDALSRSRQLSSRWFGFLGPADFVFPNTSSRAVTLAGLLESDFATAESINVRIAAFGHNGHDKRPVRGYGDLHSTLAIDTLTRRAPDAVALSSRSLFNPMTGMWASLLGERSQNVETVQAIRINRYQHRSSIDTSSTLLWLSEGEAQYGHDPTLNSVDDKLLQYRSAEALKALLQVRHTTTPPQKSDDYEPDLFDLHHVPTPAEMTDAIPDVCIAVLSCKRIGLARQTISAAIRYMARIEKEITYELVVVDNGSGGSTQWQLQRDFPFDKVSFFRNNEGLPSGINNLFFGLCRAPYMIHLEDDWIARWEEWREDLPFIKMSLSVLQYDTNVHEVWLHDFNNDYPGIAANRTGLLDVPESAAFTFSDRPALSTAQSAWPRSFQYIRQSHADGFVWGTYQNGASLKSRSVILEVGPMSGANGDRSEFEYQIRYNQFGYSAAVLCYPAPGEYRCPKGYLEGVKYHEVLFLHGGTRGRSPGHHDHQ